MAVPKIARRHLGKQKGHVISVPVLINSNNKLSEMEDDRDVDSEDCFNVESSDATAELEELARQTFASSACHLPIFKQ